MRPDHPAVGVLALGLARRLGLPDTALLPGDALLIAGGLVVLVVVFLAVH